MKKVFAKLTLVLLICALMFAISSCELVDKVKDLVENHEYVEEITKAPTCSEEGIKTFTCLCGDSYTEAIEKLPHTEEAIPAVAPTCTEAGKTEGKKCSVCDEVLVAQETDPATGHTDATPVQENFNDSTCSVEGSYDSVVYCSVCEAEVSRTTETIEKKPHTEVVDKAVPPTCTNDGKKEGKHCSVCDEVLVAQETDPATGHTHSSEWKKDADQHWHECHCGDKADVGYHSFEDANDTSCECGYIRTVAPTASANEVTKEYDLFDLENKENITFDLAENVINPSNLTLTYSVNGVAVEGNTYTFTFGTYTDEITYETITVTVSYTLNSEEKSISYTYKLGLKDTSAYRVANGGFENGLVGWEVNNTVGEDPFGSITNVDTFWGQGFPMNNKGNYFSGVEGGASEASEGTLASPYFTVKSNYATFMLGAAKNPNVYITIENEDGVVLALYRNTKFADLPADHENYTEKELHEMIGDTVFALNFVTYKVDISEYAGQKIRFVVHDHASSDFGFACFDELNTYYASEDEIPANAVLAENLLANKGALNEELALEVTEQGDYTADSYNAYVEKLNAAKALVNIVAVTQEEVDNAVKALKEARLALAVRPIEAVADAIKSFSIISGNKKEIVLSDYINTNGLSKITYNITANNEKITLGNIVDGKFTITAGDVDEATVVNVSISVCYDGVEKLTVELSIQITNDVAPTLRGEEIVKDYDLFNLENKASVELDLSTNVDNAGNLSLTYSVNGAAIEGSTYTFTFGAYTDTITNETIIVTVSFVANGEAKTLTYTYKLAIKDTTANRLVNGGFENGLEGWTQVGNIGDVSSDTHYWVNDPESSEGFMFDMDGEKMFSAYAPGTLESAVGALTSSSFKVGGSGFVTFKLGAAKNGGNVWIDVIDANTKEILARYYNGLWADRTNDVKSGCTLIAYKADLSDFAGREVFFRISDAANSDYGLFFVDSFVTYYENEPEGFNAATPVDYQLPGTIYEIMNGGFEMGGLQGWVNIGEIGVVTNASGYWGGNIPYEKIGEYLFTGVESYGADTMREGNRGVLISSVFEIGGTGWISFKLGGGGSALCYVQVVDAATGEILARYHQQAQRDAILIQYVADLSNYIGRTVVLQVVDQADSGWGCVSFDNVVTYYTSNESLPAGETANDIKGDLKYTIDNGSFESGNLDGWSMNITEAGAHNTLGWVRDSEINADWYAKNDDTKDGNFLFTFAQPNDVNCENSKGTLQSSTFSLKQGSFVSFKFGGAGGGVNHGVRIELCRADGSVIATFYNDAPVKLNTRMNSYYYQYNGPEVNCFFRVVDDSTSNYGCFVVDDFRVNLGTAPEGYIAAITQ